MSTRLNRRTFVLGSTVAVALSLPISASLTSAAAQGATPSPMGMTDATEALGIGSPGDACINVVHASPDAPNVDIYLDGQLALSNLAFGWYGGWMAVPAGKHQVQVTATGTAADAAVIDAAVELGAGVAYHIAATGLLAEIKPQIYQANLDPLAAENARIRVIHTVPDAPAVDVAVTGGDVLVAGLTFPDASDYLTVPAGSYDLDVRLAGTNDVVLPLPGTMLNANTVYEVFAIGHVAANVLAALVVPSQLQSAGEGEATPVTAMASSTSVLGIGEEGDAAVNIVHASPDAPAVDVYVDGALALSSLAFGAFSGWVPVPAGDHRVQVTASGAAPDTAVIDANLTLEAGMAYQVAATGLLADIAPQVYTTDLSELGQDQARIRVIHASPDAPAVDVAVTGGDVLVSDLAFPDASAYLEVPAGSYDLEVRPAGTMDVALALPGVVLEEGMVYDIFAIGQLKDGTLNVLPVSSPTVMPAATPMS